MDCSPPGSSVHGDSPGKNTGIGLLCLPPWDLPNPGIELRSPSLQADSLPSEKPGEQVSFQEISIGKEEKITKDGFSNTLYYEVGDRNRDD